MRNDISCELSAVRRFYATSGSIYSLNFKSPVQFIMVGVLRVKIEAVFISKPFQTPNKKIFDTDVTYYNSLNAG